MTRPRVADLTAVVERLCAHGVEAILVGGAAGVLHGSALGTLDVDVVRRRTPENRDRLLAFCREGDAWFRHDLSQRQLKPKASHLDGPGTLLLSTRWGPVDLLGTLHDGRGYDELLPDTVEVQLGDGRIPVLSIEALIAVKAAVGRPKDKLMVAELLTLIDGDTGG